MPKRIIACLLITAALLTALAAPAGLASEYYSARTPLNSPGRAKLNNITLAVEAINGTTVPYGGTFSFNETVGPRVANRGYQTAPNGRGVEVTGGGVAQAASTLYLALLQVRGDVEIGPVRTYGNRFTDSYVTDPNHAVITDYDADIDLSFTNYEDVMTIDMWVNDSYVYCSINVGDESDISGWNFFNTDAPSATQAPKSASGTTGSALPAAPIRTLLATASLECGDDSRVLHNVELAAESVNDTTLNSRDVFSFNDVVGPREKKYGYKRAVNGRGAKVTGGGVAQVASVIWLAVKDLNDISVIEKSTYGKKYNQTYVKHSSDAILTDYDADRDFSFRYTGYGSITIYTFVQDGRLYCDIYKE